MEPNNTTALVGEAARWYARLRASDCSASERQAFEQWRAARPEHAAAYRQAERTANSLSNALHRHAELQAMAVQALAQPRSSRWRTVSHVVLENGGKHWRSAAVWLFCTGLIALSALHLTGNQVAAPEIARYANDGLQERRITLADGSILHLDVGTELTVALSAQRRELHLRKGRALFEVAHDKTRPFVVVAAATQTVALGTQFQVDLEQQAVTVTLAQGSVEVTPTANADAEQSSWREVLRPGEQLQVESVRQAPSKKQIDSASMLGWSRGRLAFKDVMLSDALKQVNRYNKVKIVLGDQSLSDIPIGGSYVVGSDVTEFVTALTAALPVTSIRSEANEIVLFQSHGIDSR